MTLEDPTDKQIDEAVFKQLASVYQRVGYGVVKRLISDRGPPDIVFTVSLDRDEAIVISSDIFKLSKTTHRIMYSLVREQYDSMISYIDSNGYKTYLKVSADCKRIIYRTPTKFFNNTQMKPFESIILECAADFIFGVYRELYEDKL